MERRSQTKGWMMMRRKSSAAVVVAQRSVKGREGESLTGLGRKPEPRKRQGDQL